jgi:hypothetical protein
VACGFCVLGVVYDVGMEEGKSGGKRKQKLRKK